MANKVIDLFQTTLYLHNQKDSSQTTNTKLNLQKEAQWNPHRPLDQQTINLPHKLNNRWLPLNGPQHLSYTMNIIHQAPTHPNHNHRRSRRVNHSKYQLQWRHLPNWQSFPFGKTYLPPSIMMTGSGKVNHDHNLAASEPPTSHFEADIKPYSWNRDTITFALTAPWSICF